MSIEGPMGDAKPTGLYVGKNPNHKKKFTWASPHKPTAEQLMELTSQGELRFLTPQLQDRINNCPTNRKEVEQLAHDVADATHGTTIVQLGGSPLFLYIAGETLGESRGKEFIIFAHSERVSVDVPQEDGTVLKTSVFKHLGFI